MSDTHSNQSDELMLREFEAEYKVSTTKGPLSLLIQLTTKAFPLNADDFLTENKGQAARLAN